MQIILLAGQGQNGPRRIQCARWQQFAVPLAALLVVGGLLLWAGYQWGSRQAPSDAIVIQWEQALVEQRQQLAQARDTTEASLDALTIRLARLQAQAARVDALGSKLVSMAGLEDGEFDFAGLPGIGGPEDVLQDTRRSDLMRELDALAQVLDDRESQLRLLDRLILSGQLQEEVTPAGRPVKTGWMSSGYGTRTDPFTGRQAFHRGVDFAARPGTEIIAVAGGIVVFADDNDAFGKLVEIDHGNGYVTRYAHNRDMRVSVGDAVRKGDVIATMGATGRATGTHVHFEVLKEGRHTNPHRFIQSSG